MVYLFVGINVTGRRAKIPGTKRIGKVETMLMNELSRNSRVTFAALAKKLGVSQSWVRQMLRKLLAEDVIALELVVNYTKLGFQTAAHIGLNVRLNAMESVVNKLVNIPNIILIGLTGGRYNVMLWCLFESPSKLASFAEQELSKVSGINRSETLINLKIAKRSWDNLLKPGYLGKDPDALDRQIISILQRDLRISYARLANEVGVSIPTARQRVEHLVKEGVISFSIAYNPLKLGYNAVTIIGLHVRLTELERVQLDLYKMPQIRFAALAAGRFDIILVTEFLTQDDLVKFIQNDLASIDGIVEVEIFSVIKIVKRSFNELL